MLISLPEKHEIQITNPPCLTNWQSLQSVILVGPAVAKSTHTHHSGSPSAKLSVELPDRVIGSDYVLRGDFRKYVMNGCEDKAAIF